MTNQKARSLTRRPIAGALSARCALLLLLLGWSGFVIQTWEVTYGSKMPSPGLGTRKVGALTGPVDLACSGSEMSATVGWG